MILRGNELTLCLAETKTHGLVRKKAIRAMVINILEQWLPIGHKVCSCRAVAKSYQSWRFSVVTSRSIDSVT